MKTQFCMLTSLYIFVTKPKQDKEVYKFVLLINQQELDIISEEEQLICT